MEKMKKLDTLASHNCAKDSLLHEFHGAALTDHDHATGQFPLMGVFGLLPSLDKVVAVGCKEIFREQ